MDAHGTACDAVAARYKEKLANGLVSVKLITGNTKTATRNVICREVLRLEDAIDNGHF